MVIAKADRLNPVLLSVVMAKADRLNLVLLSVVMAKADRLKLVLLAVVMANLNPSMVFTSVLSIGHCSLVVKMILQQIVV